MLRTSLIPTASSMPAANTAGTSLLDLPIGKRYHAINLEVKDGLNATALATMITGGRIKINGNTRREFTMTQLGALNGLMGASFANKTIGTTTNVRYGIKILLAEPFRKDLRQVQLPAWDIAGPNVRSFQVELDWAAVGADTKTLTGSYQWEPATAPLGSITKWTRSTLAAAGTTQDFNLLGMIPASDYLQSIHLFTPTTNSPVKASLILNGEIVWDNIEFWQMATHLESREMVADVTATNPRYDIVIDYDDPIINAVRMQGINEARLHVEYGTVNQTTGAIAYGAATGSMPVLIQHVGPAL